MELPEFIRSTMSLGNKSSSFVKPVTRVHSILSSKYDLTIEATPVQAVLIAFAEKCQGESDGIENYRIRHSDKLKVIGDMVRCGPYFALINGRTFQPSNTGNIKR